MVLKAVVCWFHTYKEIDQVSPLTLYTHTCAVAYTMAVMLFHKRAVYLGR